MFEYQTTDIKAATMHPNSQDSGIPLASIRFFSNLRFDLRAIGESMVKWPSSRKKPPRWPFVPQVIPHAFLCCPNNKKRSPGASAAILGLSCVPSGPWLPAGSPPAQWVRWKYENVPQKLGIMIRGVLFYDLQVYKHWFQPKKNGL